MIVIVIPRYAPISKQSSDWYDNLRFYYIINTIYSEGCPSQIQASDSYILGPVSIEINGTYAEVKSIKTILFKSYLEFNFSFFTLHGTGRKRARLVVNATLTQNVCTLDKNQLNTSMNLRLQLMTDN